MLRRTTLMAVAVIGLSCFVTNVMAMDNGGGDVPPSCPGGGTATGTFHCTGPVLAPKCTEGPPWKCSIKATGGRTMEMDRHGFGAGRMGLHRGVTQNPPVSHSHNRMIGKPMLLQKVQ